MRPSSTSSWKHGPAPAASSSKHASSTYVESVTALSSVADHGVVRGIGVVGRHRVGGDRSSAPPPRRGRQLEVVEVGHVEPAADDLVLDRLGEVAELVGEILDLLPAERLHHREHLVRDGGHRAQVPGAVDLLDDEAGVLVVLERRLDVDDGVLDAFGILDDVVELELGLHLLLQLAAVDLLGLAGHRGDEAAVGEATGQRVALGGDLDREPGGDHRALGRRSPTRRRPCR